MTTYYVDSVNGSDAADGLSEVNAKQTLSAACALLTTAADILYVQAGGNYTLTSAVALTQDGTTAGGRIRIEGYTTTPGARDGRPTITTATDSTHLVTCNACTYLDFVHLNMTNTAATRARAFNAITGNSNRLRWVDCVFDGFSNAIANDSASFLNIVVERCEFKNCTATTSAAIAVSSGALFGNYIHDGAGDGFSYSFASAVSVVGNIFDTNGRYGVIDNTGSGSAFGGVVIDGNVFYNMGSDGVRMTGDVTTSGVPQITNNIFYGNAGYGQNWSTLSSTEADALGAIHGWNAYDDNDLGDINGIAAGTGDVTLTGDPFTNAASGNFALNNTAGAGAACRAAGFPGAMPGATTTGYRDIGIQHQDAGGGGGTMGGRYIGGGY